MTAFKLLKEPEIQIVHDWLRTMGMSVNRLLNREYADGFLIARLLKKMYPQLVNIHSYQRSYSYDVKTTNWRTLNFKVLRRIGLSLTDERIESLVRGERGSIEQLMWVLMGCCVDGRNFKIHAKRRMTFAKRPTKRKTEKRAKSTRQSKLNATTRSSPINCEESSKTTISLLEDAASMDVYSQEICDPYICSPQEVVKMVEQAQAESESSASRRKTTQQQVQIDLSSNQSNSTRYSESSQCDDLHGKVVNNYEVELERAQCRVQELESLIKQQDELLKMLRDRANVYDTENREFIEVIAQTKQQLSAH